MVFVTLIDGLPDNETQALRARLTTIAKSSAIGRQIEANLMLESKLPIASARTIIDALLAEPDEPASLRVRFEEICEANVLTGPEMNGKRPEILGRAVILDAFYARLVKSHGFRTVRQAQAWVKRLCGLKVADLKKALVELPLGGQVIWATFQEPKRASNPFIPFLTTPEPLHDALGLDPKSRGRPLLLFAYAPPNDLLLRFPTIADARWGRLFRPAPDDPLCECGLTAPPTDDPTVVPLPEIVHSAITGGFLAETLRILW